MNKVCNFDGPLFDPTGLGFANQHPKHLDWRHRHLAGVSYNPTKNALIAFNAEGLAMPLEHDRYKLPQLLSTAVRIEFSTARGAGIYGTGAAENQPLLDPAGLKRWITYWFAEPEHGFANDNQALDRLIEQDIQEMLANRKALAGVRSRGRKPSILKEKQKITESRTAAHIKQVEYDSYLGGLLSGTASGPEQQDGMQVPA